MSNNRVAESHIMVEADNSPHDTNAANTRTLGMITFLAKVTLMLAQSTGDSLDLISESSHFIQSYDFATAACYLQRVGLISKNHTHSDPQDSIYWLIGWTYLTRPKRDSHNLICYLLAPGRKGGERLGGITGPGALPHSQETILESKLDGVKDAAGKELPKYTETLYRKAQGIGAVPTRTASVISQSPSQVKADIQLKMAARDGEFRTITAVAVASNKKAAQHLAAKEICSKLHWRFE